MKFERSRKEAAFSLMEVVIAVGILAGAIVAIIGLLAPTLRSTRDVIDTTVAARLAENINAEMQRLGFAFVRDNTPEGSRIVIFGTADGSRVVEEGQAGDGTEDTPPTMPYRDRYFRAEVEVLDGPAPTEAVRALSIRLQWPFRLPGLSDEIPEARRSSFSFNTSISR